MLFLISFACVTTILYSTLKEFEQVVGFCFSPLFSLFGENLTNFGLFLFFPDQLKRFFFIYYKFEEGNDLSNFNLNTYSQHNNFHTSTIVLHNYINKWLSVMIKHIIFFKVKCKLKHIQEVIVGQNTLVNTYKYINN